MVVNIPANIPYKEIFKKWEDRRIDNKVNLENTVYIILDYMIRQNGINTLWADPVGLLSTKFKKICSANFIVVKRELIDRGVLIQNLNLGNYEVGIRPEMYNLNFAYCNNGLISKTLDSSSTAKNYQSFIENGYLHEINLNEGKDVQHLFDQFENLEIEILPDIYDFKTAYQSRMHFHSKEYWKRKKLRYLIFSKIGQIEQNVEDLYERKFNPKLNSQNLRFHSLFTNIIKELRSFIRINGNELVEFDLKSSNLYVLATILNSEFFTNQKGQYNLFKVYRRLHIKLTNLLEAKGEEPTTEGRGGARRRDLPYLLPTYFEREDLKLFKLLSYEKGFYEVLIQIAENDHKDLLVQYPSLKNRNSVKNMVLSFLTDTEKKHRKHMAIVKLLDRVFPSVCEFVASNLVFRNIKSPMPYLLQRAESFLVLDIVAKELIKAYPNSKVLTIHDCFLMEDAGLNRNEVINKIKQVLTDFTGITPGVAVKTSNPLLDIDQIVDDTVKKLMSKSMIKEKIDTPEEKRLFSPLRSNQVEAGICSQFSGKRRISALKEFKEYVSKLYDY
jgi:hypothetical protein